MPLPQRALGGGDFEDFKDAARAGDLVVFKVIRRAPDRDFGNGPTAIIVADVLFVTGERKGEILPAESIAKNGITNELAKHKPGTEVAARLELKKRGDREYPAAQPPTDADYDVITRYWKEHDDDPWKVASASTGAGTSDDEPPF